VDERCLRALVADDNQAYRALLGAILESQGFSVAAVSDGRQAVAAVAVSCFDLILMDINMPDMDGLTATRMIRRHEAETGHAPAKLFMVTSKTRDEDRAHSRQAGADGHIGKPIAFDGIVQIAARCRCGTWDDSWDFGAVQQRA
jgi:CheY-like chemotaxis protein